MRFSLQSLLTNAVYRGLRHSGAARWLRRSNAVVFCYHNVVPDRMYNTVGNTFLHLGASDFAEQLNWIARAFTVVSISELFGRVRRNRSIAGLAVLSFDDGYAGVIRNAVPLIRQAGLPFTLFPVIDAATARNPFWWDLFGYLEPERRERFLTELSGEHKRIAAHSSGNHDLPDDILPASWNELRGVLGDDCTIGAHSVTHRNLTVLSDDDISWELTHARIRLAEELGVEPNIVAYPYGRTNSRVEEASRRAGFEAGFGLTDTLVGAHPPLFEFPRINVPAGIAMANFACWASGLKLRRS